MVTRAGGVQWQCASAFSSCFRGEGDVVFSCKGSARFKSSSRGIATSFEIQSQVDCTPCNSIKKKVAMWIGYVGTHYKGLQIQRSTAAAQTIEQELETAIFRAGGILESNFGSLEKIRWMRSSRTDKGVHSLSTVISFKMEVYQDTWGNDDDGVEVAERINQFLPNTIRIFSVVPVNKSFDSRRACCSRSYNYLLPAITIGITENTCDEVVQQRLVKFQNILSSLTGRHPYHNYTVRSQYRKKYDSSKLTNQVQHDALEEEKLLHSEDSISEDEFSSQEECKTTLSGSLVATLSCSEVAEKISLPRPKIRWLHELDMADKIFSAHFRHIFSFTCEGLQIYQGLYFLKLSVHGESFMLHQVRKMVGTAIAIMRDVLPEDIIPISLALRCRVALPLAPSEGLLLASNEFYPFRTNRVKHQDSKEADDLPRLKMSARVLKRKEEFWLNVLLPHMIALLKDGHAVWNDWLESLEVGHIPNTQMDEARVAWRDWWLQDLTIRALKGSDAKGYALSSPDGLAI